MDGIVEHEVAVGTKPKTDDLMTFTGADIIARDVNGIGMCHFPDTQNCDRPS